MMREGVPIGAIALTRSEVQPFTDKQIELVTTFADQAAIAIENVRLFDSVEARARTGKIVGGPARDPGPPGPDAEACFPRPAHRWHCARDQEPAQFRQQFLRRLGRID